MKRHFLLFALCLPLFAAGTVQQSVSQLGSTNNWVIAFRWTGDATTGSVPITAAAGLSCCQGYLITQVETIPGTPSPTAGYSVQILDGAGVDALGGAAATCSATAPQSFAAASSAAPVQGAVSLKITGQLVASAQGAVYVFLSKPGTVNLATLGRSTITSSPNWLTLANPPFVDVRTCGATGNGSTDDAAAINSCLTTASQAVYFPPGTYKIASAGLSFGADNISLICAGASNTTIILGAGANLTAMVNIGAHSGITIQGCTFEQNAGGQSFPDNTSIYGITMSGASNVLVADCVFHGFANLTNPVYAAYDSVINVVNSRNITIRSNKLFSVLAVPIQGSGNTYLWVIDNTFGSNSYADSLAATTYWDNAGGGVYPINLGTSSDVHINRNVFAGFNRNPTWTTAGGAVIGLQLTQSEIGNNIIDGLGNGYGTATVTQGNATVNFTVGYFATVDISGSRKVFFQGDGTAYLITGVANCLSGGTAQCSQITVSPAIVRTSAAGLLYQWPNSGDLVSCEGCQAVSIHDNILRRGGDQGMGVTTQFSGHSTVDVSVLNNKISSIGGSGILIEGAQRGLHIFGNVIRNVALAASLGNQNCITLYPDGGLGPKPMYFMNITNNSCIDDQSVGTILYGIYLDSANLTDFAHNSSVIGPNLFQMTAGSPGPTASNLTADQWNTLFDSPLSTQSNLRQFNSGMHMEAASGTSDVAGTCTFGATTCTVTFNTAFNSAPACTASDQTAAAPIKVAPAAGSVVLTGGAGAGATDVVAYHCWGAPN